jgi:hypothetical protein
LMRLADLFAPGCLAICLIAIPNTANTAPITGSFYIEGTAVGTTNGVDFFYNFPGDQRGAIALPTTGSFSDLTAGNIQTIQNATSTNGVIPGTSFDFMNWIQLTDGINLDLTSIPIPSFSVCPTSGTVANGTSCLVNAQSPIVLTQRSDGVAAALSVYGLAHTAGQSDDVSYVGLFSAPSVNFSTIADFEAFYNANGGIPAVGYSANFTAVPEPRWLTLVFGGLLAAVGFRKKTAGRKQ